MFIPLRTHSVDSRGKGSATLEEASAWVSRKGMRAAALTDIENLYGWAKWKRAAEARGFRPLFGCELEVDGRQFVFLVKSRGGYWNLMEIFNQKGGRAAEEDGKRVAGWGGAKSVGKAKAGAGGGLLAEGRERTDERTVRLATDDLVTVYIPKAGDVDLASGLKPFVRDGSREDFYLGCDFSNFERVAGGGGAYNLPVVWANPVKFIQSPEGLILLPAIPH